MIPALGSDGLLRPGIHEVSWLEFEFVFARNEHRAELARGLRRALLALKAAGCGRAYVDGSFVTAKEFPNDWDGCWDLAGVQGALLDPVLLQFEEGRRAQKRKYGGEFFASSWEATENGEPFLSFFQQTRDGRPKGIVAFDLRTLT
jgi:hypothetical protein